MRSRCARRRSTCVVRPTPSVPSITISHPVSSAGSTPGTPTPYESNVLIRHRSPFTEPREMWKDRAAQPALLHFDRTGRVHHLQSVLGDQLLVLLENPRLEQSIRFAGLGMQSEIHAGLVPLELGSSR